MYNDKITNAAITDLESKEISIVENALFLASQGYVVNKAKRIKLDWTSILLNAFENINVFSVEQQQKIERLYDKVSTI